MRIANVIDLAGISAEMMDLYETNYLRAVSDPPPGLLTYVMGPSGDIIRIVEIWESEEARNAFYTNHMSAATDAYLDDGHPPLTDEIDTRLTVRAYYSAGSATVQPQS